MLKAFLNNPKASCSLALRIGFGGSLLLVGLVHYQTIEGFVGMTSEGLGPLEALGTIWAYILPALMIVGGALLALGRYANVGAICAGIALASIPIGMLLKSAISGVPLPDVMPMANNALIWLIVYTFVVKMSCCGDSCSK